MNTLYFIFLKLNYLNNQYYSDTHINIYRKLTHITIRIIQEYLAIQIEFYIMIKLNAYLIHHISPFNKS